jgi:hypothetical protein
MSMASEAIQQQFPGRSLWYLKPRELDAAIFMVEEGLSDATRGHFRIVYLRDLVAEILNDMGWPANKVANYMTFAKYWASKTKRAPVIMDRDEIEERFNKRHGDYDGDGDPCNLRN